ncbi:MAG: hypothetical protein PF569_01795 [Candidatus Woesearchaeota archaeon]|jgi:hypothetical protein|nr:hypothetical protein [Candidatus Woesearchaeota archaeon]
MNKFVKVPLERIRELLSEEFTLIELEGVGVDNWHGYEECEEVYPEISDKEIESEFTIFELHHDFKE